MTYVENKTDNSSQQESTKVLHNQEYSVVQESLASTNISAEKSSILVHFKYGEHKFPKRVTTNTYIEFYREVSSILQRKMDGYKPHNMQYQCGSEWYDLNQDADFDDLCLNKDQVWIQAVPIFTESGINLTPYVS